MEYADKLGDGHNAPLITHQDLPLPDLKGYRVKWTLGRLIEAGAPPVLYAGKPLPPGYEQWDHATRATLLTTFGITGFPDLSFDRVLGLNRADRAKPLQDMARAASSRSISAASAFIRTLRDI